MKSRYQKETFRRIVKNHKQIQKNPAWWGDEDDEFSAPYVNHAVKYGLSPDSWTYSENSSSGEFSSIICSFIYTYVTKSGNLKNRVGNLYLSSTDKEFEADMISSVPEGMEICFDKYYYSSGREPNQIGFHAFAEKCSSDTISILCSFMAGYLTEFHNAKILFIDSNGFNKKKTMERWGIFKAILESYWDYAEGGCRHMYRMKKGTNMSDILVDDTFEPFEISKEELARQKESYKEMAALLKCACGDKSFDSFLRGFQKNRVGLSDLDN